jgi:protein-disulfide isomerase
MARREEEKRRARERIAAERAAQQARAKRIRMIQIIGVVVIVLAIVAVGIVLQLNRSDVNTTADPGPQVAATKTDNSIVFGDTGPHVDIYLDFLCSHCKDLEERLGDTISDMVESGDITLALHPVTLIDPTQSQRSAAAFACAADTGSKSLLGYEKALYDDESGDFTADRLIDIAKSVGIEGDDFSSCVRNDEQKEWAIGVNADALKAVKKLTPQFGTPTIVVDGKLLDLNRTDDPADFRAAVEELAG